MRTFYFLSFMFISLSASAQIKFKVPDLSAPYNREATSIRTFGKKDRLLTGDGDFTLDMYGWRKCRKEFEKIVRADLQNGTMKKEAVIISYKWFPAAHTDYYIAMPLKKDLLAIGISMIFTSING